MNATTNRYIVTDDEDALEGWTANRLAAALRAWRARLGLTQEQAAEARPGGLD